MLGTVTVSFKPSTLRVSKAAISCRDATHGDNASLLKELEAVLNSSGVSGAEEAYERWRKADPDPFATVDSQSSVNHVRTGRLRRRHVESTTLEGVSEVMFRGARGTQVHSREAQEAMGRLEEFFKVMRGPAERLAEPQGQSADAFSL